MKLFLQTLTRIRIIHGDQEWHGTLPEFQVIEPTYPGLPVLTQAPAVARYQTPELKYIEDSNGNRHPDLFDALSYCERINDYTPGLCVYVHHQLSTTVLNADDPQAHIDFEGHFKASPNPDDPDLPLTAAWLIKLRHDSGITDLFEIAFTHGVCAYTYRWRDGLPLGDWYLSEADFDAIPFNNQTYQVKLVAPVRFRVYRLLT